MEALIRIEDLSAGFQRQTVLHGLSLRLPPRGLVGLMGPAAVGKSTLLRTLGRWNEPLPSFWRRGKILLEPQGSIDEVPLETWQQQVPLMAQKSRLYTATVLDNVISEVRGDRQLGPRVKKELAFQAMSPLGLWEAFEGVLNEPVLSLALVDQRKLSVARLLAGGARCLLADEPLRDLPEADAADLSRLIRRVAGSCCVLMVTHNQRFARQICDQIILLVGGRIVEVAETERFFTEPSSELAQDYIKLGSCWPHPQDPSKQENSDQENADARELVPAPRVQPGGFHWVLMGLLGGMQRPGLMQDEDQDLAALAALGCKVLVSLTRQPFSQEKLQKYGDIECVHFPIQDMGVPTHEGAHELCARIVSWIDQDRATVLHCKAGLGRTGTILACTLVYRGDNPAKAIGKVRSINPYAIQSQAQLDFISSFAEYLDRQNAQEIRPTARA